MKHLLWILTLMLPATPAWAGQDYWARAVYVGTVAGQAGDLLTTEIALSKGAREANPIVRKQAVLIPMKVGVATLVVWAVHKSLTPENRKKNRLGSLITATALIGLQGWVIWHNVGVIHQQDLINGRR